MFFLYDDFFLFNCSLNKIINTYIPMNILEKYTKFSILFLLITAFTNMIIDVKADITGTELIYKSLEYSKQK